MSTSDAGAPRPNVDGAAPAAGDAARPTGSLDAAADAGPAVRLAPTTVLTSADLSNAVILTADADGIYWVTRDNQLWMLPTGNEMPRQLAVDLNPTNQSNEWASLLARGDRLFWTAEIFATSSETYLRSPLHRTQKTGEDVVLVSSCSCEPPELVADDTYLYFPGGDVLGGAEEVVALALDAEPGTAPTPLASLPFDMDVSSLAVDGHYLYWTAYPLASTVQIGVGPVTRGDKASLLAGSGTSSLFVNDWVAALEPSGGELYFVYASPGRGWSVGRVNEGGARANLRLPGGNTLLVLDHWVLSATTQVGAGDGKIYAVAADAVAGDGRVAVQIADQVLVPPVAGLPGLVFVDDGGHLVAVSAQDLGVAVAAGQR